MILPYYWVEEIILIPQIGHVTDNELGEPITEVPYFVSDILLIFMFIRIGFVLRTLENFDSITDAYSKKLCRNY